jgi:hypothetical protein
VKTALEETWDRSCFFSGGVSRSPIVGGLRLPVFACASQKLRREGQRRAVPGLIAAWSNIVQSDAAAPRMAAIKEKIGETSYAWSGSTEKRTAA